jgi:hypothetical protein
MTCKTKQHLYQNIFVAFQNMFVILLTNGLIVFTNNNLLFTNNNFGDMLKYFVFFLLKSPATDQIKSRNKL